MKLVKQGDNFIILSDADVAIEVIKKSDVIDGDAVSKQEAERQRYVRNVQKMQDEKLLDMFATAIYMKIMGAEAHKNHDLMCEVIYEEIINRMKK